MSSPAVARFPSAEFNAPHHWFWSDVNVPQELKSVINDFNPKTALELGCGLGGFSTYLAQQGIQATGVDVSSVAIEQAKARVANEEFKPNFLLGDVTDLSNIRHPFDMAFDVGCFHCLDRNAQEKYITELHRLLRPNATLLMWCLENSPADLKLNPEYIEGVFGKRFELYKSTPKHGRIIASHWYWLERK